MIAKAKGSAGLIERRSAPETAAQRLIEQPAIQKKIGRELRGPNLQPAKRGIPPVVSRIQRALHLFARSISLDQCARFANIPGLVKTLQGCDLADVPVLVLTIDPCISCTER